MNSALEGSWSNLPLDVLAHVYHACVTLDQGRTVWTLTFLLTCKNWRKQAGLFITKLTLSDQGPGRLRSAINVYPHLQSSHLHRVSLNFSQFEDIGKLPNLRHLSLVCLKRSGKAGLVLLESGKWQRGAKRSAFQFLQKLVSLELGAHRQAPVTSEEYEGLSHLTNLQHITLHCTLPRPTSGQIPYGILRELSALTSLEVEELQHGISQLTSLQSLSIPSGGPFHFTEGFSNLQGLTALAIGPHPELQSRTDPVMAVRDLLSLKVFCSLQNLTLTSMMGGYMPAGGTEQAALWEGLATLTSVKHLELRDTLYTDSAFTNLAKMTQLTCLNFYHKSQHVKVDAFDEQLAALSTLTSLDTLRCNFRCYVWQIVWSPQKRKCVAGPKPAAGIALKAALPQAASMSVFAIKLRPELIERC